MPDGPLPNGAELDLFIAVALSSSRTRNDTSRWVQLELGAPELHAFLGPAVAKVKKRAGSFDSAPYFKVESVSNKKPNLEEAVPLDSLLRRFVPRRSV